MMQIYTIYADVLFFLNFFMDFFLLWATGRFLRIKASYVRLLAAAFIGALYGVGMLFPNLAFMYTFILKIAFSFLLLRVAFSYQGWKPFLQSVGVFYLIAFAMAGAVLGGSSLLASSGIDIEGTQVVRWTSLIFAVAMAGILSRKGVLWIKKNWRKENFQINAEIFLHGRRILLPALIDTGNDLCDPVTTSPVIVVEYQALRVLLPQGLRDLFEKYGDHDPTQILQQAALSDSALYKRLRLIPFASIGKNHGMLMGFKPDKVVIYDEKKRETEQVIIAVCQDALGEGKKYQAIINPDVLEVAQVVRNKNPKKESLV